MPRAAWWWAAVGFGSVAWVFLTPYYSPPHVLGGVGCVVAAVLAASFGGRRAPVAPRPGLLLTFAVLGLVPAVVLLFPVGPQAVFLVLASGLVLSALRLRGSAALARGATFVGTMGLAQAGVLLIYDRFLADQHTAVVLSWFDQGLLGLLGHPVSAVGEQLIVGTHRGAVSVTPSWGQLALPYGLVIACGVLVTCALARGTKKMWGPGAAGLALLFVYLLARRFFLLLFALPADHGAVFWNQSITAITLLPFFFLGGLFVGLEPGHMSARIARLLRPTTSRGAKLMLAVAFVGTFAWGAFLHLAIPGPPNVGSVCFDEAHGEWSSTRPPLDKDWYGRSSVYNFASLYDWLSHYREVVRLDEPFTPYVLEGCGILVLGMPSELYSVEEIDAIKTYVASGGALLVVADHTNVFGTTTVLNEVLAPFGVSLNTDATYELTTQGLSSFTPPRLTAHPTVSGIGRFQFLTSCTINTPWWTWKPIMDAPLLAAPADYATDHYFPQPGTVASLSATFGVFCQMAAVPYGRGRVIVFSDSTVFSSFCLHMDAYPELMLGILAFLSHENPRFPYRVLAGAVAGSCTFLVLLWLISFGGAQHFLRILVVGCAGVAASVGVSWWANAVYYPMPEPEVLPRYVHFDTRYSSGVISSHPVLPTPEQGVRFETLFVWTQRAGAVPRQTEGPERAVPGTPYVIIDPIGEISDKDLATLSEHVESGGALVVLAAEEGEAAFYESLGYYFGLELERDDDGMLWTGEGVVHERPDPEVPLTLSVAQRGYGLAILVSNAHLFSNAHLGSTFTVPSPWQMRLYQLVYYLFEELTDAAAEARHPTRSEEDE